MPRRAKTGEMGSACPIASASSGVRSFEIMRSKVSGSRASSCPPHEAVVTTQRSSSTGNSTPKYCSSGRAAPSIKGSIHRHFHHQLSGRASPDGPWYQREL